jgi:hypothetical protein
VTGLIEMDMVICSYWEIPKASGTRREHSPTLWPFKLQPMASQSLSGWLVRVKRYLTAAKKPKYHIYCLEDSSRAGIANGVATVISSVFPVLPVVILFFVPRLIVRLVLIVFTVGFAAVLVFGMNVNSEKVLAITTA